MELELTGFGELEGVGLLQKLPIFSRLTYDETTRLSTILQKVELPAGSVVIEENALGDALYVIQEGEVKVSRDSNQDGVHSDSEEIGRLAAGELFGEMSLIDDLLTSARVTTVSASKLLKLPKAQFDALLQSDEKLAVKVFQSFARTLSDRLRRANLLLQGQHALQTGMR